MQLSFLYLMIFLFILQNIVCAVHYAKKPKCDKNCQKSNENRRAIVRSNIDLINVRLNLEKEKECMEYIGICAAGSQLAYAYGLTASCTLAKY